MSPLLKSTIMSQYANSPVLLRLIEDIGDRIDPTADIEQFYNIVMNLHTAQGFGLDIWGRIVGISRRASIANPEGEYFGFADGFYPFNQRPFFSPTQNAYELPDNVYRDLIFIKATVNIINATAPNINRLMKAAFNGKKCYFLIVGHMKGRYVFEFALSPFERYLVYNTDILPRPCGVQTEVLDAIPPETFGFTGTGFQPFNQGTFYGGL